MGVYNGEPKASHWITPSYLIYYLKIIYNFPSSFPNPLRLLLPQKIV